MVMSETVKDINEAITNYVEAKEAYRKSKSEAEWKALDFYDESVKAYKEEATAIYETTMGEYSASKEARELMQSLEDAAYTMYVFCARLVQEKNGY